MGRMFSFKSLIVFILTIVVSIVLVSFWVTFRHFKENKNNCLGIWLAFHSESEFQYTSYEIVKSPMSLGTIELILKKVKEEMPFKNEKYKYVISAEPKADITKIVPLLEVMSRLQINDMEVKLNQYMPPSSNKEIEIQ